MRPRTLAIIFGAFFAVVGYFSWTFAAALPPPGWFPADITRWIYTTYMLVAAIFLVGLGGLALSIRRSFARQIRELEGRLQRGSGRAGDGDGAGRRPGCPDDRGDRPGDRGAPHAARPTAEAPRRFHHRARCGLGLHPRRLGHDAPWIRR